MWTILLEIPQLRAKRQCLFGLQPNQALVLSLLSLVHVFMEFHLSNNDPVTQQFTAVHKLFLWQTLQYLEILYKSATFPTTCNLKYTIHKYSLFSATNHVTSEHNIIPSCEISGSHSNAEEDLNSPSTQFHTNWWKMSNVLGRLLSLSSPSPLHKQMNE